MDKKNISLMMDYYELTMSMGYFQSGEKDKMVYFDMFFRKNPDDGGYAIAAGLEQLIEYIESISFSEDDIEYLKEIGIHNEEFLEYLKNFKFTGDIWAVPEGTPVFPNEPIVTVRAPIIQAQLIETALLLNINHQTLIATKANRLVRASKGKPIIEFGARRAQGVDGAYFGARASFIGGCVGTSNVMSGRDFDIPVFGTMAHSWIQMFDDEYEAFKIYAETYPESTSLLVDTYNTLKSGVPNAIRVFNEINLPRGYRPLSIRLDSGDLAYLSKEARKMLDAAGFEDVKIIASNSIDEFTLKDLKYQGAEIDIFGIGEKLITSSSDAVLGGVYKLVAVEEGDEIIPKIKVSENIEKITTPGYKKIYRLYDKKTGKAMADVLTLNDETIDDSKPYELFDPLATWKRTIIRDFEAVSMQKPVFISGKKVYEKKDIKEIQKYSTYETDRLWDEVKRINKPHKYYVDLSYKLWKKKEELLEIYAQRGR
ncbi:MAG: nicotinate phosphoribosyltransferase [Clostridiales bacterium]|nr:MAG: nicotinate phosphoribosyltransferase [Clostridiales bacterium]